MRQICGTGQRRRASGRREDQEEATQIFITG